MIVVQENGLDIGHLESQLLDILLDRFGCDRVTGPKHDVSLRRRQQVHLSVGDSGKIKVAHNLERLSGPAGICDLLPDFQRFGSQLFTEFDSSGGERRFR